MKVVINKSLLNSATQRSQGAITERSLAQIGLRAQGAHIQMLVADRVLAVYNELDCHVKEPGELFVPAKLFTDVVKELPDGDVNLEVEESFLIVTGGQHNEFLIKIPKIEGKSWREPPEINSSNTATLPCDKVTYMVDQVQFCVAHESTRNYGAVGYFHKVDNEKLRLVGTDGYRLSYSEIAVQFPDLFLQNGVCLSKRALTEIQRMCNEGFEDLVLAISEDEATIMASVPGYKVFARLANVKYPNYQGVLPKSEMNKVTLSRSYFQSVAKRVLLASDKTRALQLHFSNGMLVLRSRTVGSSESKESIILEDYSGGETIIAINGKFLTDVFSTISSDTVALNFNDNDEPIMLYPKEEPNGCHSLHVLVPITEN